MKVLTKENPNLDVDIVIEYRELTPEVEAILRQFQKNDIHVEHRGREFAVSLNKVLFFETETDYVYAHTHDGSYKVKYRLYELEELLPHQFQRISKSAIVNCDLIASIERNLSSSRSVQFYNTHKIVYVSRMFFPILKKHLDERSL